MTLHTFCVSAGQVKLSSSCATPHLLQGGKLLCEINTGLSLKPDMRTGMYAYTAAVLPVISSAECTVHVMELKDLDYLDIAAGRYAMVV